MAVVCIRVMAGLAAAIGGGVLGFVMGASFGGNHLPDLAIGGARGYEATAPIGALLGAIAMAIVGYAGATRLTARWSQPV